MNLATLRSYIRDLTGVYATDLVSDSLLTRWVNEAYNEIDRMRVWPWSSSKTELVSNTDEPVFDDQFHAALAYRVSAKVLGTQADETGRIAQYVSEFDLLVGSMVEFYFPAQAAGLTGNLAQLRATLRDFAGAYVIGVSDATLNLWLNEAYDEVERMYRWPWAASKTPLVSNTDEPAFEAQFRSVLAYRAAVKVLTAQNATDARGQMFAAEAAAILESMRVHYFPADATGYVQNLAQIRATVRDLVNDYSKNVSDGLLTLWVNDAYDDVARPYNWPWSASKVPLVAGTDEPVFEEQFRSMLAYMVAVKVLAFNGDTGPRGTIYSGQADAMLAQMVSFYFPEQLTSNVTTFGTLKDMARVFAGEFSKSISDQLIYRFLSQSYGEVARMKPWPWLEGRLEATVPAYGFSLALPQGSRRVLSVYRVNSPDDVEEGILVPHTLDVPANSTELRYEVDTAGTLSFAPVQSEPMTVRVRYINDYSNEVYEYTQPYFAERFRIVLAYMAAVKILEITGDKNAAARIQSFNNQIGTLLSGMIDEYILDHDDRPFQLGGEGIMQRRYIPWFKAV